MKMLKNNPSVNHIQQYIFEHDPNRDYTYIILGQPGPTGKTTLQHELYMFGYDAFEITEELLRVGRFEGKENMLFVNEFDKCAVIVLNQRVR